MGRHLGGGLDLADLNAAGGGAALRFTRPTPRYMPAPDTAPWGWNRLTGSAVLPGGGGPVVWDFGSAAGHHQLYNPWLDHTPGEPTPAGAASTGARAGVSTLRGAFHPTPATVRAALAFLASGAHPWGRLIPHRRGADGAPPLRADPPRDFLKAAVVPTLTA